jgi:hypothetical protein
MSLRSDKGCGMHPNVFLKSLWGTEVLDQVFVAMSVDERFEAVIRPTTGSRPFSETPQRYSSQRSFAEHPK